MRNEADVIQIFNRQNQNNLYNKQLKIKANFSYEPRLTA